MRPLLLFVWLTLFTRYLRRLLKLPPALACSLLHAGLELDVQMAGAMISYARGLLLVVRGIGLDDANITQEERSIAMKQQQELLMMAEADYFQSQNFHIVGI